MLEFEPTHIELLFRNALALIAAACLFVPIFTRIGAGAVLGYLAAGLAVKLTLAGSFSEHPEDLLHFAEFGVVLFLFVIGLELKPSTLWQMRSDIFGLGFAQLAVCGVVLALPVFALGYGGPQVTIIGLGLALSSTAMVMQTLDERGDRTSPYGRKSFAILLFQDLAIVPLLLLVALLAPAGATADWTESLIRVALAVAAIGTLVLVGRYLLDPMFRLLARTQIQEIMTASALGIVIAAALLMDLVGMSYAMGAFIAGVMLAESSYRHEVEANIEPFRGLFLGLFFMAIGLSVDLGVVAENWRAVLLAAPAAMTLKGVTIYGIARAFGIEHNTATRVALALPQHGEFAFVLFAAAASAAVLDGSSASVLVAIVSVSMALSPLVQRLEPMLIRPAPSEGIAETYDDAGGRILIIGFGRFGQIVSQPLLSSGIEITTLDNDANRIREAQRFGFRVYFGDGTRRDVLRAAGADSVDKIVICVDDERQADEIVALVQAEFAQAQLFVRSYDRRHSMRLALSKVDFAVRETFESALRMGERVLVASGVSDAEAEHTIADVRKRDRERLRDQMQGDTRSGLDRLHVKPVRPEPLPPKK